MEALLLSVGVEEPEEEVGDAGGVSEEYAER